MITNAVAAFKKYYNVRYRRYLTRITFFSLSSSIFYYYIKKNIFFHNIANEYSLLPGSIHCKIDSDTLFTIEDVKKHGINSKNGFWTIYKNRVYDITDFVDVHPGGNIILEAVGNYLDPYFTIFNFHNQPEVLEYLDSMAIGYIDDEFMYENIKENSVCKENETDSFFTNEPDRSSILNPVSIKPFNAETPLEILDQNFITDVEAFYARSHHPIPLIDSENYRLEVCYENELVNKQAVQRNFNYYLKNDKRGKECICRKYSLKELDQIFSYYEITATIQCAGNRRKEMNDIEPVKGLQWSGGAIGNALWGGYRLREVLLKDNILYADKNKNIYYEDLPAHVVMTGLDKNPDSPDQYETSIPLYKALDPATIIATKMNNQKLTRDHGYPARVVVPGVCGARSVKWLQTITVTTTESNSRWQQFDYKTLPSSIKFGDKVDFKKYPAIQATPVTSFICNPKNGSNLFLSNSNRNIVISGYAFSGNGNAIKSVEVTIDGGIQWIPTELQSICSDGNDSRCWSWTLWKINLPIPDSIEQLDIAVRATDAANNVQPINPNEIWNMRGLLNNSINHCHVFINKHK